MEEKKLCQCCKKNHVARSYQREENNQGSWEFYCLECYSRLFLDDASTALTDCPFCGTQLSEVAASKIVGCAHCYAYMQEGLFPIIRSMQGGKAHRGKIPPLDGKYGDLYDFDDAFGAEYRAKAVAQARFERQSRELEIIIKSLKAEGKIEDAKGYEEKLTAMKNRGAIEEDFVWRIHHSKQR